MDSYLAKYSNRYDKWLQKNEIAYMSRVLPIHREPVKNNSKVFD